MARLAMFGYKTEFSWAERPERGEWIVRVNCANLAKRVSTFNYVDLRADLAKTSEGEAPHFVVTFSESCLTKF